MPFQWKDSFSVNIEEIDNQHKKLFEIGSRIYDIVSLKDDCDHYDEIMELLEELRDYTVYHFEAEEALMQKYGYEDFERHQFEHKFFVKKLERVCNKDIDRDQTGTIMEMVTFIADWITGHILKSDMNYKEMLNKKGVY